MGLPAHSHFEKDEHNQLERRLIIHDVQIKNPFTMKTENNIADSLPFRLYDIFNHFTLPNISKDLLRMSFMMIIDSSSMVTLNR